MYTYAYRQPYIYMYADKHICRYMYNDEECINIYN